MQHLYFNDVFGVSEDDLEAYGAFNVSLVVDLPLFVDPFLLFNSEKSEYQELHQRIIGYLRYLRELASAGQLTAGRVKNLFCFPEVRENWLGFSLTDNRGRGLGMDFANALAENLHSLFIDFGEEEITKGSHLEKLCLIREGVGRDMISDFTTNLILRHLCEFTQGFAMKYIAPELRSEFAVNRIEFNTTTGSWSPGRFILPKHEGDYVLLTPKDILTKDDTWINKEDFVREYDDIPTAIGDRELRAQVEAYFRSVLPRNPKQRERADAVRKTALRYPVLYDYFIKWKEDHGDDAEQRSMEKVEISHSFYVRQFREFITLLGRVSEFYREPRTSKQATVEKVLFLKDVIENKGGFRSFYFDGEPMRREEDLKIMFRLVWHKTNYDVSREVNDGRGPADFKISNGALDKTIVEMKLASNTALARNLEKQVEIYQKASDAESAIKVIIYFTAGELRRVEGILSEMGLSTCPDIFLIDARDDNKPSASKA